MSSETHPLRPAILFAFASIYLIWGSTYLAIRIGIETLPPFVLAGVRFTIAGALLLFVLRLRGEANPTLAQWRSSAVVGGLMMFGGNGMVTLAETRVESGLAALLVTTVPLWMVVLDATVYGGPRLRARIVLGLLAGLVGVGILVDPRAEAIDPIGALILLGAAFSWANGSLLNRRLEMPRSPWMAAATQMLTGGVMISVAAVVTGQAAELDLAAVSGRSLVALVYLVVFGSIVALSSYVFLLRETSAAAVATYAFVNPVIALLLGWAVGEALGPRALVGAVLIVGAVFLIHRVRTRPAPCRPAIRLASEASS